MVTVTLVQNSTLLWIDILLTMRQWWHQLLKVFRRKSSVIFFFTFAEEFISCLQSYCTEFRKARRESVIPPVLFFLLKPPLKLKSSGLRLKITDNIYQGVVSLSYSLLTDVLLLDSDVCRSLCSCYNYAHNVHCQGRGVNSTLLLNNSFPTNTTVL